MAQNEIARATVDVDGQQAGLELKKLEERARELRSELSKLGKDNDLAGFRQKEKELKLVNTQMKNVKKSTWDIEQVMKRLNGSSLNELTRAQRQLSAEVRASTRHTKEEIAAYDQKIAKLKQVNTEINKVKAESALASKSQRSWFSGAADGFNKYFGILTAGVAAFTGITMSIKSLIQGNVELDDSLADVRKTTGLTQKEVRELFTEFNTLNTRTPKKELLELAEEAGRLGIEGKKNIMDFVDVANQIKVALGDDLGGNASEAIKEVGKLTNVFKVGEKYGVDFRQSMLMVGSSINEVSANSAADAPFLIDMAKRMAGVSSQAGIAVQDIIGMAAALDEMGQTSEVSSTTLNKVIVNMFKDTSTYADLAGMSLQDFTDLLGKDANDALLKVLEGLNGNNTGLSTMAQKLDGLGLDGARSVQTLAALASNIDLVKKNQDLANTSLEKGTSLTNEYQIKNNNMAGSLAKIGRALKATFVSSGINEALTNIVTTVAKWVEIPVSSTMESQRTKVNLLAIELTNLNTTEERKKAIYDELNAISPKIVEGLRLESINTEQLQKNLARYNEEAIKKIAIQRAQEDLNEIQDKVGKQTEKRSEAEYKLNNALQNQVKLIKGRNEEEGNRAEDVLLSTSLTALDKFKQIHEITMGIKNDFGNVAIDFSNLNAVGSEYTYQLEEENKLLKEADGIMAKYQDKYKSIMGISSEVNPVGNQDTSPWNVPNADEYFNMISAKPTKPPIDPGGGGGNALAKLSDQQAEFRMRIINESKSLIEQENLAYEQRLKDAEVFDETKRNSTAQHQEAFRILEQQHLENLKKINYQAYSDELLDNQKNFDQVTMIRETAHNNEMAALGNNEEAKKALEEKFQKEELERQQNFLFALIADLQGAIDGEDTFKGLDEKLLSEEQKEVIKARLIEVGLAVSDINLKLASLKSGGAAPTEGEQTGFQSFMGGDSGDKVDIFGMTGADWKNLIQNIQDGNITLADTEALVHAITNAWGSYYDIKNNLDQQDLMKFEADTTKKKELLQKQLDTGIITQEEYNERSAMLEEDLDTKRKEVALKAAKREKKIALMNAIVNTAAGIVKMLNNPWPLNLILAALVGVAGGLEIAKIATTPLPQYAMGRYDVLGAQDGKKYNAKVIDSPGTGLVNSPAILVGEKPEIIIDPYTTRNLQMNYPEVIQAINAARMPQYASGSYPGSVTRETVTEKSLPKEFYELMAMQATEIKRLNDQLNKGIGATLVADGQYMKTHTEVSDDYQALRKQVRLRS